MKILRQLVITAILSCFTQQAQAMRRVISAHKGKIVMPRVKKARKARKLKKMAIYGVGS